MLCQFHLITVKLEDFSQDTFYLKFSEVLGMKGRSSDNTGSTFLLLSGLPYTQIAFCEKVSSVYCVESILGNLSMVLAF